MNQNLYFFKHNNFKNRLYKPRPNPYSATFAVNNANFNTNDGVDTSVTINYNSDTFDFDYIMEGYEVKNGQITTVSYRGWYITEAVRKSGNQIVLTLKRDIIGDYFVDIKDKDFLIHRGICSESSSAIYNNEGFQFNQIKTRETLIKDQTSSAWIIGYIPNSLKSDDLPTSNFVTRAVNDIESISSISSLPYASSDKRIYIPNGYNVQAQFIINSPGQYGNTNPLRTSINYFNSVANDKYYSPLYADNMYIATLSDTTLFNQVLNEMRAEGQSRRSTWESAIYAAYKGTDSHTLQSLDILSDNGKIYLDTSDNKYYRINIYKSAETKSFSGEVKGNSLATTIYNYATNKLGDRGTIHPFDSTKYIGEANLNVDVYIYETEEIHLENEYHLNYQDSGFLDNGVSVNGQPYKAFVFPYSDFRIKKGVESVATRNDLEIVKAFISHWSKDNGNIIDLQLVPFCPIQNITYDIYGGYIHLGSDEKTIDIYNNEDTLVTRGFWMRESNFKFNSGISHTITNMKEEINCKFMRLCSPHYESAFEFNAGSMNGFSGIKIECTYKPYSPYFHLCPIYGNGSLFGKEQFDDCRGLISNCGYSLPLTSDAWETYQHNNATYQLAFDRQIENFNINRNIERIKLGLGSGGAVVGGALGGYHTGGVVGAYTGGTSALFGSMLNMAFNEAKANESLSYSKDKFSYELRNIQATQQTLTKVSALDINNRLYPILEYYECTEEERLYFSKYLYYNSYSIERVGKIQEYIDYNRDYTFIQAEMLRLEVDGLGTHELNYMNELLNNGWYFTNQWR